MRTRVPLEPAAEAVCRSAAIPPLIFQMPPERGRMALDKIQDTPPSFVCPAAAVCQRVSTGSWGEIPVWFVKPETCLSPRSVIFYLHGAGWVFGNYHTHEKLVRELAARTDSLVVFPEYARAPEARYPVAVEQCYSVLCALPELVAPYSAAADPATLTVAGDSAGGNLAIAMTLLAKQRRGPRIHKQLLYYPVTDACFNTPSYRQFAAGYYLYRAGMEWFWQQYAPVLRDRACLTASPLRARVRDLCGMPQAMIINGEADVLRDEGEAYAGKLRLAGVDVTAVRVQGIIHDFVMLNALDQTDACRTAMDLSTDWVNRRNQ